MSYELSDNQDIQFSYGRRITRPTFNDLAPFIIYLGANNLVSGNAALQPALSHSVKLQYRWKTLTSALEYHHEKNTIAPFQPHFNAATSELHYFAENLKSDQPLVISMILPWQPASWWSMQNAFIGT